MSPPEYSLDTARNSITGAPGPLRGGRETFFARVVGGTGRRRLRLCGSEIAIWTCGRVAGLPPYAALMAILQRGLQDVWIRGDG
jgi:hypothetical protein